MKYILVSIAFVSLSLSSCNRASEAGNSTNSVDIFNKEQVAGLCTHNSAQRKEAMQTLEKGLKTFRVDKKPAEAVTIITSAITKYPTAGAYFELGNAYATAKDYAKAIDCYNMAEQMGFTPVSKLFYNVACAYSLSEKNREASQYLEYAMEAGYINKNQLMKDPDLNNVRKYGFSSIFAEAMKGIENADNAVLETFWQAFATLNLPFNIDFTTEKTLNPEQLLQYHFEKYIPEMHERDKFSRGTGDNYFALGTITQNEKFRTVVYAQCADIELGSEVPAMYFMVSYDNNGTIIDKMLVCGHRTTTELYKTCSIDPNLSFTIKEFKNTYKVVEDENSQEESLKLLSAEQQNIRYYKISDEGKFVETKPAVGFNSNVRTAAGTDA